MDQDPFLDFTSFRQKILLEQSADLQSLWPHESLREQYILQLYLLAKSFLVHLSND